MILSSEEFRKKAPMYKGWVREYLHQKEIIANIDYQMSKIPSMFPDTTIVNGERIAIPKAHGDPRQKEIRRLEMIEEKAEHEKLMDEYYKKYIEVEEALNRLPEELRKLVENIYIYRNNLEKVAREMYYSKIGLYDYVDKRLDKFLKPKVE